MGSVGSTNSNSNNVVFNIEGERLDDSWYSESRRDDMREALQDAQEAINDIVNNSWYSDDVNVDRIYESLADYYPQAIYGNDGEKIIMADTEYLTTVYFSIYETTDGKIDVTLTPYSYSIDEFSDQDLKDMHIYREYLRERRK